MKNLLIFKLLLFCIAKSFGQMRHDNNWIFNAPYGEFVDSGAVLQFHPKRVIDYHLKGQETYFANTSYSDKFGNLLFYTNGCVINDQNHNLIVGGDSINYGTGHWSNCLEGYGYGVGPQSAMFLPKPYSEDGIVTLVHLVGDATSDPIIGTRIFNFEIRSTNVIRKQNFSYTSNKNKVIWRDTFAGTCLVATKHTNNQDWWLVIPDENGSNTKSSYNIFRYGSNGFSDFKKQKIGDLLTGVDQSNFSPNGKKYAIYNWVETYISLFDFDRTSGTLSNYRKFNLPDTIRPGGCAFSPNSRFLYVTTTDKIWQFDTEAANINESRVLVAVYDGFTDPTYFNNKTYFWQIQQGPDCKLYINSLRFGRHLGCINRPNEKGLACDVQQHSIYIRTSILKTLPYFPNYRLGTPYENECDTITTTSWLAPYLESESLSVIPNPTSGQIELKFARPQTDAEYTIFSITGEIVQRGKLLGSVESVTVLLDDSIPGGIYHIVVKENQNMIGAAKFVVIK